MFFTVNSLLLNRRKNRLTADPPTVRRAKHVNIPGGCLSIHRYMKFAAIPDITYLGNINMFKKGIIQTRIEKARKSTIITDII